MQYIHFLLTFFLSLLIISLTIWQRNFFKKISNNYETIQKIHSSYIPPFGGIILFFCFNIYIFVFYEGNNFFKNYYVFIPSLLIIIISLLEDLYANIAPIIRFSIIFFSSLIFCIFNSDLPTIELWKIGDLINSNSFIRIVFFSLCLTALTNGMNMIDGMNGLAGLTSLSITSGIIIVITLFNIEDFDIQTLIVFFGLIITFLVFNFPFGKIFLGDSGAYWIGWILGALIIEVFSNNKLNSWIAVLLVFYPTMEVCFSTIRKILNKKNPLLPDTKHLHIKLFYLLKGPINRNQRFNSFTTLCLMPFWIVPILSIIWVQMYIELAKYFLIIFICLYLIYYFVVPDDKNKK